MPPPIKLQNLKTKTKNKLHRAADIIGDVAIIAPQLFLVIGLIVIIARFWIWVTAWPA